MINYKLCSLKEYKNLSCLKDSLSLYPNLKKIILKPLCEVHTDFEVISKWQVMNEIVLYHMNLFAKQKNIDLQVDLSSLARPIDEKGLLNQTDPVMKKTIEMFWAVNFRLFHEQLKERLGSSILLS